MAREVELLIHDREVQIWHNFKQYATVSLHPDGRVQLSVRHQDGLVVQERPFAEQVRFDTYIVTNQEEQEQTMAPPRLVRKKAATSVRRAQRPAKQTYTNYTDRIDEHDRDAVLTALLDSMLDHPDQSRTFRATETKRIAAKFDQPLYAVAGVRAALTRGTYGDQLVLLTNRRKARSAARQR